MLCSSAFRTNFLEAVSSNNVAPACQPGVSCADAARELGKRASTMTGISVVIPTYNRAGLIGEALDAVLAQSVPPDEVIVVDDGSTDSTAAVLAGYGGRVRHLQIPNSGDLVARNTGLRAASGRLVAFCDSDDVWMPGFLHAMSMQWQAEPRLVACYANFRILRGATLSTTSKFDDAPEGFWAGLRPTGPDAGVFDRPLLPNLLHFQPFFPSCMAVSRAAFLALGGWDECVSRIVGCDLATAIRIAMAPPVGVVCRPLVAIRKHDSNFSSDTEQMNLGDARVLDHVLQTRPELAPYRIALEQSTGSRRRAALEGAFTRGDFAAVREIYRLLPREMRGARERVKRAIAGLPAIFGMAVASLVRGQRT